MAELIERFGGISPKLPWKVVSERNFEGSPVRAGLYCPGSLEMTGLLGEIQGVGALASAAADSHRSGLCHDERIPVANREQLAPSFETRRVR
jgi:hypothetical protein